MTKPVSFGLLRFSPQKAIGEFADHPFWDRTELVISYGEKLLRS